METMFKIGGGLVIVVIVSVIVAGAQAAAKQDAIDAITSRGYHVASVTPRVFGCMKHRYHYDIVTTEGPSYKVCAGSFIGPSVEPLR
jgi:hypothetical protein